MPEILRTKLVRAGGWKTLESGWRATFSCRFQFPIDAEVKIRYGGGWPFGWDSQKKTLDGNSKILNVTSGAGSVYARVQMKVARDATVNYHYIASGP